MENAESSERKTNWILVAGILVAVFGVITVLVVVMTSVPKAEGIVKNIETSESESKDEYPEATDGDFIEPERISDEAGGDLVFSREGDVKLSNFYYWSDYLNLEEIKVARETIEDYFSFAFPNFSSVTIEKIMRDGKKLEKKEAGESSEDMTEGEIPEEEVFFDDLETEEEEVETEDNDVPEEGVLESTRLELVSDTGRKFYADIDAGRFGFIDVIIYLEKGQEIFRYEGENNFDTFDYSDEDIIDEAFLAL